ncbi:uncharacterized protein MCYG_07263 [Microsporum canis CBS 113480]|uniref:Uncharacterized protein n=1 Tax=Arthroderma otae (strain ATCC MYA-4605 / CBS 113480) TaxID=554155 RepID=C5FY46_ARTOC|nr:uncharacterized protein MCYG_07263 [Microsporum canis CBS 113480]EEQ34444.1 predicted protein [Microsporum canis CBS 113480]
MGNTQSRPPQRLSRPLSYTALAASSASSSSASLAAKGEEDERQQGTSHWSTAQPCRCQWCIDYAVPDPYQTPSTPLEEFLEFRRQFLSRMGGKGGGNTAAASASPASHSLPADEDEARSPASTKMDGFKRRFSRSKTTFQRRLSLVSNGEKESAAIATLSPLQPSEPGSPPAATAVVGLGLVGDDGPPSPQNPPSGQPRLVSARRRSFNRFTLFNKSAGRHASHPSDSFFHYKSSSEPLRRSWTDAGAGSTATAHHRPRTASPARAISPCEQGYTHLGTLKFGSLHVVNGCASPAPSSKRQRSCPDLVSMAQSETETITNPEDRPAPDTAGVSSPESALSGLSPAIDPANARPCCLFKRSEHENVFEDEGMEIPVYWDDTVQSHESFHDPQFHSSLSRERQEAKKDRQASSKRSGALNKTDSGYSSASGKSTSRHLHGSSRRRSSRDRNCRVFDGGSSQALIHCNGSINDPVEGTISITSHGNKEVINAVFPWPPAHLRYPVERYTSQAQPPKQQPQETHSEPNADALSEYNLDPTYPVRVRYEPSRPPPIPPRFRQAKTVSRRTGRSDSQHTQYKPPSPKGLAIDIPREPSPKRHNTPTRAHAKGHSSGGHSSKERTTRSHTLHSHPVKKHQANRSNTTKTISKRHRDSTPARMTGGKPPSASQLHARSASDATSSRPSRNIDKDKPLPALPQPRDFQFPTAQMLTPPLSRSTSMGDLKLMTNSSSADLINYIDNHTPVEIDSNLWGSLSADPDIDLELLPLNLDLNKSAFHDYQPRKSLQESINQPTRQPSKLHRSASHFSFTSSVNEKPSYRYSTPVRDVFSDRKFRKAKHHSGPPPTSYRMPPPKTTVTEDRSNRLARGSSSSCAAQAQTPGALNHIESYI